ncbi:hypothetical protein AKJ57_05895 [candidate division MSBL1 archaeon SCGC-AAA259A05]|uniref:SHOCT domain-containing protein n=1 Tax=candidate division MSBL1 archaeon SCGC-AAA259A05 TaxID=1698259 RepID=A0A133U4G3_9EURY|nr:hypothetical protein AKJ57_05895 [candidate division MSBL1 archaeon SCGC-AAA259A05]
MGERMKFVKVVAVTVLILTLLSPVAAGQHPEKDFSVSWRRILVRRVDNTGLKVKEVFSVVSKRENAENIIFMVDRDAENLTTNRDLDKTRKGLFYEFSLKEPISENQSLELQVQYDSSDLSFSRPVYYSCENVVVNLEDFGNVEIESSVPIGRRFSVQFGDNISIKIKENQKASENQFLDIGLKWILLIAVGILLLILSVFYFSGWSVFGSTPADKAPTIERALKRLEEDFKAGKIPEKAYENILEKLGGKENG